MSRDRDRILEQALKHELSAAEAAPGDACLDAETLAAWEDGGLDSKAMEAVEIHVAACARCQALVGAMARGVPSVVPADRPSGFRFWSWWLAPVAAATAAVTLWIVLPGQQQLATAPPVPSVDAPAREVGVRESAQAESNAAAPVPAPQQVPRTANQNALKDRALEPAAASVERDDRREPQAIPAQDKNEQATGKLAAEERAATTADAVTAAPAAAPAAPPVAALQKSARFAFTPVEIVSPNSSRRWRVVATGVESSIDRGASWFPVRAVGIESLTGGVSPSGTICWLIGKDGAVLVTADGATFARVDLPARVDATAITATDARSAIVTTADGRKFSTNDSGRNWRQN